MLGAAPSRCVYDRLPDDNKGWTHEPGAVLQAFRRPPARHHRRPAGRHGGGRDGVAPVVPARSGTRLRGLRAIAAVTPDSAGRVLAINPALGYDTATDTGGL